MRRFFSFLLLCASVVLAISACSEDNKGIDVPVPTPQPTPDPTPQPTPDPVRVDPTCWKVMDGDFLTSEDVIVSTDSTSININKAYLDRLTGDDDIKQGDVISVFTHGLMNYFQVDKAAANGEHYMSYAVKEVNLQQVLGICKIDMSNVQLSSTVWKDMSKPKRVNNSGEADPNGLINTDAYIEHAPDGSIIYHPIAYMEPAFYEGMNEDEEGALVTNGYVGCYIGMIDDEAVANGLLDDIVGTLKKVSEFINPVEMVTKVVVSSTKTIVKLAKTGKFEENFDVLGFDYKFMNERWDILNRSKDSKKDFEDKGKPIYAKEEWKAEIKPKVYVTLDGHFNAHTGLRMLLDLKPFSLERFEVGLYANADIDIDAFIEAGVQLEAKRPISIKRFTSKQIVFDLGPVPVVIVIYPELLWKTKINSEILLYAHLSAKTKFEAEAIAKVKPTVGTSLKWVNDPDRHVKLHQVGISGVGTASTGPALRFSCQLYGFAGPVFDICHTLNFKSNIDDYWDFDKDGNMNFINGAMMLDYRLGQLSVGGALGFPPLKDISSYLYEKMSIEFEDWVNSPSLYRDTIFYMHSPKPLPFGPIWDELTEELKEEWEEMKK